MPSFILELEVSYSGNLLKEHKPETILRNQAGILGYL